jgi:class 3 adenylate cyclase
MEFGILGPLAVWRDGDEIELGAAKQRTLLAVMLLHAGETMATERLVDALWGEQPPARAVKALQVYVSQLRKTLGDGVLETRRRGYALTLEDGALDLQRFERLLAEGQQLLGDGAAEEAGEKLRQGLALWRGEPLADFRYEAFAANAIGRLEELRLIALEQRLEADLAVGRNAEAVAELEALVRDHPLRESLRGVLMRALYRSGRQADALAVMQDTRATLLEELGLDPGQPLQQLEKAILVQDPALDLIAAPPTTPPRPESPTVDLATPPHAEVGARAQRKVVTVVFADVAGSTELGESLDPEALRSLLAAYFERMQAAAERHGGVVEKFIGDAVMAVFGVPAVHEDDALRALRAAVEMRHATAELGLEGRIGVESGEVVVGTAERLVTGRAVTTAARLEQAARAGEILVGEGTMELAGDAVTGEPLEPITLKGKPEPVPAWRLVTVSPTTPLRDFDSPFVGRAQELRTLCETWDRVRAEGRCELVTVVGAAGVGKSRLVSELLFSIDCEVGQGRCLSYGAGVTYWPVVEALTQLRGALPDAEKPLAAPLRALLEDEGTASTDELAWAFRKFVEAVAREHPLALVFDDIQWAEDALLDLIEHVAFVSSGAPILLLCMARPELHDRRPGWRGVLRLEPLSREEAEQLVHARLGAREPDPAITQRIVAAADGNPLFVQELAAMLQGGAADELVPVPPTIQAVLAARLDQLDEDERTVLESAAIEGEVFHLGAVQALTPAEERLTARLTALVRKEFVHPDRAVLEGEDGFRFRHLLLRDAAYDAIPKAARSDQHARYAEWLGGHEGFDALVGHHLAEAYRYRIEVGASGPEADGLALGASERLQRAGAVALARSDLGAARTLYTRAAGLPPVPDVRRARLLVDLAGALVEAGEVADVDRILMDASAAAEAAGDAGAAGRVRVERQFLQMHRAEPGATDGVPAVVDDAVAVFERYLDPHGLSRAWQLRASADWMHGGVSAATKAWERAAEHARRSGNEHERSMILRWLASATFLGTMPVDEGIARCEEIRKEVAGHPSSEAEVLRPLAGLHGLAGRFELARSLFAESNAAFEDLGLAAGRGLSHTEAFVEMLAGNLDGAEGRLRSGYDALETQGEIWFRSTTAALLARVLLAQDREAEAERYSEESERLAEPNDLVTQILWRGVRARVLAAHGRFDEAESLARKCLALVEPTDLVSFHADALLDLATVLEATGRSAETSEALADALALYEKKGNVVAANDLRARLDALTAV